MIRMVNYYQKKLFSKISYQDFLSMKVCLAARECRFLPGETICTYGEGLEAVGILAEGEACVVRYEVNGSRTILEHLGPQDIFGENLAFRNTFYESISVVCESSCQILFINYDHITKPCAKSCPCHQQLIQNMLNIVSEKTALLSQRIEVLTKRTIRDKLSCLFLQLACQAGSPQFQLPFSMVDLADYLSVDRSAMTRELKKMREEGLVEINRRQVSIRWGYPHTLPLYQLADPLAL